MLCKISTKSDNQVYIEIILLEDSSQQIFPTQVISLNLCKRDIYALPKGYNVCGENSVAIYKYI